MTSHRLPVKHYDIEFVVWYEYQPAERQTLEYPGCEESIEISGIYLRGPRDNPLASIDLIDVLSPSVLDALEEKIWEALEP